MTRTYSLIAALSLVFGLVVGGTTAAAASDSEVSFADEQPLAHYPSSHPCRTVTWWDGSWRITFHARTTSSGWVWITQRHRWLGIGSSHISTTRCWKVYSA
jgi:hypothetical protein